MPEIRYQDLDAYLDKTEESALAPLFLLFGDEYLCKTASDRLINKILPESDRNIRYEEFDGENESVAKAIDQINTYSLLSNKKVVAIRDSRIFYSRQESERIREKARQAFLDGDLEKASLHFVGYLALLNLDFEDLEGENRQKALKSDALDDEDDSWVDKIIAYCRENGVVIPSGKSAGDRLADALKKGFPKGNRLIMTTDFVDKRRALYTIIRDNGLVIDCFVPMGARKADKDAQNALLNERLLALLARHGKSIEPGAMALLAEKTGFDLRTFTANIEKLVDYVGKRSRITTNDVDSLLSKTKIDPIFELTNAVSDRNPEKSLLFLNSLLSSDVHPLQVLAAVINQFRKLLVARSFLDTYRVSVRPNMHLNEFKSRILPFIHQADNILSAEIERWNNLTGPQMDGEGKDRKTNKNKARKMFSTELIIAKNPNNLFPILQTMRQAGNFSMKELDSAMTHLQLADRRMKTSPMDTRMIVQKAIIDILGQNAA